MKLLALDTATEACSVAVNLDGEVIEHFDVIPRRHSRELLPMVDSLLAKVGVKITDMDALAFGCGPGAFTGLRVATAMAQGLAFAVDLPVIPVSTLAALAQQGLRENEAHHVLSAIDARMGEVYWGAFSEQDGLMLPLQDETVVAPERVSVSAEALSWFGMGTGWAFRDQIAVEVADCVVETYPHALDIAVLAVRDYKLGKLLPAEQAMPVYLRDKVALKKSER
ncbi:tRNA (adenosine(37)-N6)-threonylcarbamoyltransferase complex dimerization subunit type 1 TsaB [Endozoicomonas sp. (ex Bugula neritina AB1)]|nr:tRNA (adenosine(37)-N6)-threonylcarbamoyltransferase complex dimerization subunit type 1 TsaB [Endozoicomonas sp. (ex Bugula neritina AB1)]